jgi:hypothetical protein
VCLCTKIQEAQKSCAGIRQSLLASEHARYAPFGFWEPRCTMGYSDSDSDSDNHEDYEQDNDPWNRINDVILWTAGYWNLA